jgi:hypothetical protein
MFGPAKQEFTAVRGYFASGPRLWACETIAKQLPKINKICDLIASLEMEPHDAELLRKMMFDFRARHPVSYRDLMKIPGIARVWTTTETLAALSCVKREGAGLPSSTIGKTEDDWRK